MKCIKPGLFPVFDGPVAWLKHHDGKGGFVEMPLGNSDHEVIKMLKEVLRNLENAMVNKSEGYAHGVLKRISEETK